MLCFNDALIGRLVWLALAVACAGCSASLQGRWQLVRATPNREAFALDDLEFRGDGSYAALATIDGNTGREVGTYRFNGVELHLLPQKGGQRTFEASVAFSSLELSDKQRRLQMRRAQ